MTATNQRRGHWLTMETAPRDGTPVTILTKQNRHADASWQASRWVSLPPGGEWTSDMLDGWYPLPAG